MGKDVDFVRLNLDPLASTIQANARAWVKELGKFLNESAREDLNALKGEIEVYYLYTCSLLWLHKCTIILSGILWKIYRGC